MCRQEQGQPRYAAQGYNIGFMTYAMAALSQFRDPEPEELARHGLHKSMINLDMLSLLTRYRRMPSATLISYVT